MKTRYEKLFAFITIVPVVALAILVVSCQGTGRAYKAAEGIDQNAKVVAEHYYALVREANALKKSGVLAGGALVKAQQLVRDTRPAIDKLSAAAQAFGAVHTAETEAELEAAITAAAIAITELIDIIKAARTSSSLQHPPDEINAIAALSGKTASPAAV